MTIKEFYAEVKDMVRKHLRKGHLVQLTVDIRSASLLTENSLEMLRSVADCFSDEVKYT